MTKPYVLTADVQLRSITALAAEIDLNELLRQEVDLGNIDGFTITHCEPGEGNEGA